MTTLLRPYVEWLKQAAAMHDASNPKTPDTAVHVSLSPAFKRIPGPLDWESPNKHTKEELERLRAAKRFVMEEDFNIWKTETGRYECEQLFEKNPYIPYPTMYIQLPYESVVPDVDGGESLGWYCFLVHRTPEEKSFIEINGFGYLGRDHQNLRPLYHPMHMAYGVLENEDAPSLHVDIVKGFDGKSPAVNKTGKEYLGDISYVFLFCVLTCIDLINNYPVEHKTSSGRLLISNPDKITKRDRIAHNIVKIGQPVYDQLAYEIAEKERVRHREHDVRGHWRRLKNGRQTWVNAHKRGDPELGSVESEYDVKPRGDESDDFKERERRRDNHHA